MRSLHGLVDRLVIGTLDGPIEGDAVPTHQPAEGILLRRGEPPRQALDHRFAQIDPIQAGQHVELGDET